eukprot:CAMPEP_0113903562 /NCGR_PEP_ID=MMETSP0780_2-20120614/22625_1 /TAXON_ID=652834 /ORGANISM="Palpitomonas bilix" /LENGTH=315 /DNA_ID=CAMNT_0000896793 /DNA_START=263 /DNA_END=1210 /DNA_ORIENTATION=- /assembly_acc=CAM_ASM_000599
MALVHPDDGRDTAEVRAEHRRGKKHPTDAAEREQLMSVISAERPSQVGAETTERYRKRHNVSVKSVHLAPIGGGVERVDGPPSGEPDREGEMVKLPMAAAPAEEEYGGGYQRADSSMTHYSNTRRKQISRRMSPLMGYAEPAPVPPSRGGGGGGGERRREEGGTLELLEDSSPRQPTSQPPSRTGERGRRRKGGVKEPIAPPPPSGPPPSTSSLIGGLARQHETQKKPALFGKYAPQRDRGLAPLGRDEGGEDHYYADHRDEEREGGGGIHKAQGSALAAQASHIVNPTFPSLPAADTAGFTPGFSLTSLRKPRR